jgi:D-threo-aldose 1-dehydrogenase
METLELAGTGRTTSRLGYGCTGLMGALGRKPSLALLEAAFTQGIRHFDVAPMYGYGEAEGCLGEFLARHRGEATVTTKFGLAPARNRALLSAGRRLAGPVLRRLPGLKRRLARTADTIGGVGAQVRFSPEEARASLERSLRALGVERIDVWLLHEAQADDLADDRLLRFLEDAVASGKIATFGVGSEAAKMPLLLSERREYCGVAQFEWSVLDPVPVLPANDVFRIHHRALTANFRALHEALREDAERCERWSRVVGQGLGEAEMLAALMLRAALDVNLESVILFSSKSAAHIEENVRIAGDKGLTEPAQRLYGLVQAEGTAWIGNPTRGRPGRAAGGEGGW